MGNSAGRAARVGVVSAIVCSGVIGPVAGTAAASPFCYQTGPGYQKCVDGTTGGYQNPLYQGPRIFDGVNQAPAPAPVYAPVNPNAVATQTANSIQSTFNGSADMSRFNVRVQNVSLNRTGANVYDGLVRMTSTVSSGCDVPVRVTVGDAGDLSWNISPEAMGPLFE